MNVTKSQPDIQLICLSAKSRRNSASPSVIYRNGLAVRCLNGIMVNYGFMLVSKDEANTMGLLSTTSTGSEVTNGLILNSSRRRVGLSLTVMVSQSKRAVRTVCTAQYACRTYCTCHL